MCTRRAWLVIVAAAALAGCGFHLEGHDNVRVTLGRVHIDARDTQSDFYIGLRRALLAAGTQVDDVGTGATGSGVGGATGVTETVIHILEDGTSQRVLAVSATNAPTEYELTYRVRFAVSSDGKERIAPEVHTLIRNYSYNEAAQLAKQREQATLASALARELVSVAMRRLASL